MPSRDLVRRRRTVPALLVPALLTLGALAPTPPALAAGRPTERAAYTLEDAAAARPEGLAGSVRFAADDPAAFRAFLADALRGASAARAPWLALSGGGENGAFAAGLLAGWSGAGGAGARPDSGARPEFGVVTGVSTGALIAPFAFAGRQYDEALRRAYTETTAADVFEFGGSDEALTDNWPLRRGIERSVTPELLADVAAAHRAGRRLIVVTTDVDTGRPVAWDMGAIAAAGAPGLKLFREVMLASAAVPGVFPPVMIDAARTRDGRGKGSEKTFQEMHADGGATQPFYVAPGPLLLGEGRGDGPIPAHDVYVVVNGRLAPDFEVTRRTTLTILGRSLASAIVAQTRTALALNRAFAAREGLALHVAAIDARFARTSPAPFDQGYMRALYEHGLRVGRAGTAFDRPLDETIPDKTIPDETAPDEPAATGSVRASGPLGGRGPAEGRAAGPKASSGPHEERRAEAR